MFTTELYQHARAVRKAFGGRGPIIPIIGGPNNSATTAVLDDRGNVHYVFVGSFTLDSSLTYNGGAEYANQLIMGVLGTRGAGVYTTPGTGIMCIPQPTPMNPAVASDNWLFFGIGTPPDNQIRGWTFTGYRVPCAPVGVQYDPNYDLR